ncbi:MAG: hypothetical protein NC130_05795 [Lachnoclostridium sp.]|nr:hypothetical protein [Lachnoclostridium sp.]
MVFNSFEYAVFFVIVFAVFFIADYTRHIKFRNVFLLGASYYFYAQFHWWFIGLLVYVTLINYIFGRWIAARIEKSQSTRLQVTSAIILTLAQLVFFKYAYLAWPSVLLPVGLSFFTFQALTYTIDLYRGKVSVEKNIVTFALFVAFFPTLLCGPIERARNMMKQLNYPSAMSWNLFSDGLGLFIWGLFKKVVIADRLAIYVNTVYFSPENYTGSSLALAAIFYSFQIYCDFSGYADMASGTARMLGFDIIRNFNLPYCVRTIKEFWRRWNISLTSWFTEYVYISMGGNRVSQARWILNISTVFLLSGIWHGATWSFIVWGAIHAVLYLIEYFLKIKNPNWLYHVFTFVSVTVAWIFFRIENIGEAAYVVSRIFSDIVSPIQWGSSTFGTVLTVALLLIFVCREWLTFKGRLIRRAPIEYVLLMLCICLFGVSSDQFVYFQF